MATICPAKTPEQLADEQMEAFTIAPDSNYDIGGNDARDVEECSADYIRAQIIEAIEADRAQRSLVTLVAEALDDRGATLAADLVRDTDPDDDLWNCYIGPMLDSIEHDYTVMARGAQ